MRDTYEGKLKPGQLSQAHIRETYNELNKGAKEGYGKNWTKVNEQNNIDPSVLKMQQNIFKFSMAKDYSMLLEINRLLTKDTKKTNWEDFKAEVLKLNKVYNVNYLQAEWQTARQAGNHAVNWEQYQKRKHLYPNLKYRTQEDDRVRDSHDKLKNIIAPIDGSFWKSYYPPNGWRCRCFVVQTAEPATKDDDYPLIESKDVKPEFKNNVGISGQIYKETSENKGKPHPFFALTNDLDNETKKVFELMKLNTPSQIRYEAKNGTTVRVNPFTDTRIDELLGNYRTAVLLAEKENLDIELRPHTNGRIITGISNPEYLINGRLADRKSPTTFDYTKTLSKANKQSCEIVVFDLSVNKDNIENAYNIIINLLSMSKGTVHSNIKEVYIISADKKTIKHYVRKKAD